MADDRKPAFAMLFCGSMLRDAYYVTMSANMNLMGTDVTPAEAESLTLTNLVTKNTPPTLILLCHDDNVVRPFSSTKYYTALKQHGVPASMHIYPSGGHSWWSNRKWEYRKQWLGAVHDWLTIQAQTKREK
jgi:acetyl esterase/lipase